MIEAVNNFIHAVKNQAHIFPLIQQADLQVNIKTNHQAAQLVFQNGEITARQAKKDQPTRFEISGSQAAIELLLKGKERLRALEGTGRVKVNAPLRTVLLLESIFYLTRPDSFLEKII